MGALLPALPLKADAVPVVPIERISVVSPDGGAAWRAMYEGNTIPAEPIEDHEPVVERVASKVPRRDKSAALVAVASSTAGITNTEIRELTGWTKFGGFHDAVKRAGLQLRRVRENGDTRWFARPADQEAAQAA